MSAIALLMVFLLGVVFLVLAAIWVLAAVYVLRDARRRNVSHAGLWALGTLLVGPVGLVAYLVDRPRSRRIACAFCGEMILDTDRACPYCGRAREEIGQGRAG